MLYWAHISAIASIAGITPWQILNMDLFFKIAINILAISFPKDTLFVFAALFFNLFIMVGYVKAMGVLFVEFLYLYLQLCSLTCLSWWVT